MTEDNNRYFFFIEKGQGAYNLTIWRSLLNISIRYAVTVSQVQTTCFLHVTMVLCFLPKPMQILMDDPPLSMSLYIKSTVAPQVCVLLHH